MFDNIARRARMASVSLQIEGTVGGDATDDGSWGLGDAADDALSALKTVAGVMLVGAAIVLPVVALIALIAWLTMVGPPPQPREGAGRVEPGRSAGGRARAGAGVAPRAHAGRDCVTPVGQQAVRRGRRSLQVPAPDVHCRN